MCIVAACSRYNVFNGCLMVLKRSTFVLWLNAVGLEIYTVCLSRMGQLAMC